MFWGHRTKDCDFWLGGHKPQPQNRGKPPRRQKKGGESHNPKKQNCSPRWGKGFTTFQKPKRRANEKQLKKKRPARREEKKSH